MTKVFSLFMGFYIFILALCIWLVDYHLIYPIAAMTISARKFAYDSEDGFASLKSDSTLNDLAFNANNTADQTGCLKKKNNIII